MDVGAISNLYVEDAGLCVFNDDMVDSRLIHDDRGLASSSKADVRAILPRLLTELSRDCGGRLPSVES